MDLSSESIKVKLTAPPVEGRANQALIELISAACRVPKVDVEILAGKKSRRKTLLIRGLELSVVIDRLSRLADA